jgi:hypothetical protein
VALSPLQYRSLKISAVEGMPAILSLKKMQVARSSQSAIRYHLYNSVFITTCHFSHRTRCRMVLTRKITARAVARVVAVTVIAAAEKEIGAR